VFILSQVRAQHHAMVMTNLTTKPWKRMRITVGKDKSDPKEDPKNVKAPPVKKKDVNKTEEEETSESGNENTAGRPHYQARRLERPNKICKEEDKRNVSQTC
jgi:hypothetical protein